jgi:hypothetical protein
MLDKIKSRRFVNQLAKGKKERLLVGEKITAAIKRAMM